MKSITISAPGKLMLFGEHAVVYDRPCIVTSVNARMHVTVSHIDEKDDEILVPQVKKSEFVEEAIRIFKSNNDISESVSVETKCEFSHNHGLGSSSAVTSATLYGLNVLFNIPISKKELFDLSYHVVKKIQGVGSGFDIAAAVYGRTIYFVTGGKMIKPLSIAKLPLIIGCTGVKADTAEIVKDLRKRYCDNVDTRDVFFERITGLVEKAKDFLQNKDWEKLGGIMNKNQSYLKELGVSSDKLNAMTFSAREAGAYGAKLSGAGGGDCMIALASKDKVDDVKKAIEQAGGEIIHIKTNAEGVRVEA